MSGHDHADRLQFGRAESVRFLADLQNLPTPLDSSFDADLEGRFRLALSSQFPTDNVVGEELPDTMKWAGSGWLIDPLDGTTNLTCDLPWFGASFSYIESGWPTLGWVIDPVHNRVFEAISGQGASLDGVPLVLPELPPNAVISVSRRWRRTKQDWRSVLPGFCIDRLLGATALELVSVANGQFGGGAWGDSRTFDIAAGWLVLIESGAHLVSPHGVGVDSWAPLVGQNPKSVRLDLVAGHPKYRSWLDAMIDHRSTAG